MLRTARATLILAGTILVMATWSAGCVWEQRDLGSATCENGLCEKGETPSSCAADCPSGLCGNHLCELHEDALSCPADCSLDRCGNGTCSDAENLYTCPEDCPWSTCGNGVCEAGEEAGACAKDCFVPTCGNGLCEASETNLDCPADCPATRKADLLFVVDSSLSMAREQAILARTLPLLYSHLRQASGDHPDLHVGVVSTDLGAGDWHITFCGNSQEGRLLAPPEAGLAGFPFMIDQAPRKGPGGCEVLRDSQGDCASYTCGEAPCDTSDGTAVALVEDSVTGCPRCRNFQGTPDSVFQVLATPGIEGCGFEQPLEAMFQALDEGNTHNAGFLRHDAMLAVMFVTDEDDCSVRDPHLFDTTQTAIDSELGPQNSYRCFEFGVTCEFNSRFIDGERPNCVPRTDPGALLYPIERYRDFLLSHKQPGHVVVRALAGPVVQSPKGLTVTIGPDGNDNPMVQATCSEEEGEAYPGVRLWHFLQYFNAGLDMDQAYHSICSPTFADPVENLGVTVKRRLTF